MTVSKEFTDKIELRFKALEQKISEVGSREVKQLDQTHLSTKVDSFVGSVLETFVSIKSEMESIRKQIVELRADLDKIKVCTCEEKKTKKEKSFSKPIKEQ